MSLNTFGLGGSGSGGDITIINNVIGGALEIVIEPEINIEIDEGNTLDIDISNQPLMIDVDGNFKFSICKGLEVEV